MSEKLCVHWNDFQNNIKKAFRNLREDNDFADVTLVCEDGQQVEAHKVILAASSPFFQKLLGRNKHAHPLIYMKGVKFNDLLAIVDFLYFGEANVDQENLQSFLVSAEELQLSGLLGKTENTEDFEEDKKYLAPALFNTDKKIPKNSFKKEIPVGHKTKENRTVAIPENLSGDLEDLEERVKSMMEKSQNRVLNQPGKRAETCKVCGKEGQARQIKDHIEANHLEGINIPCNLCDKTFSSRNGLRLHKRQHQNQPIEKMASPGFIA